MRSTRRSCPLAIAGCSGRSMSSQRSVLRRRCSATSVAGRSASLRDMPCDRPARRFDSSPQLNLRQSDGGLLFRRGHPSDMSGNRGECKALAFEPDLSASTQRAIRLRSVNFAGALLRRKVPTELRALRSLWALVRLCLTSATWFSAGPLYPPRQPPHSFN